MTCNTPFPSAGFRFFWWSFLFSTALLLLGLSTHAQKNDEVQAELREKAMSAFQSGDFQTAAPLFSQLLSLNQGDSLLLYYYGASLSVQPDKSNTAVPYLEQVSSSTKVPRDVNYYYGRALMSDGRYMEAAAAFRLFLEKGSGTRDQRVAVERFSENCMYAAELVIGRKNVPMVSEREIPLRNFFASYEFIPKGGKVVPAAEQFLSKNDRAALNDPVMFISGDQQVIYLARLGKTGGNQTDIFQVIRQSNGEWSESLPLNAVINSLQSEDFPFMVSSGRTLYFSSKGFNSIGGYDIFRSDYDYSSGSWSAPVNMGIPVNTIGDDMLFVPSADGKTATYVTTDRANDGRAFLRSIELPTGEGQMVHVQGFYRSIDQQMRRDARISVVRQSDRAVVVTVNTDPRTGQYSLDVSPDEPYFLIVEGGGYVPHIERFELPQGIDLTDIKQSVAMDRVGNNEQMQVKNYFRPLSRPDEPLIADEQASQTLTSTISIADVDSSSLVTVRIGDKILKMPPPQGMKDAEYPADIPQTIDSAVRNVDRTNDSQDDEADLTAAGASARSPEEQRSGGETVSADDATLLPDDTVVISDEEPIRRETPLSAATIGATEDVTDEKLAELALEDARDNREDAAEIRQEAAGVRKQVEEKRLMAAALVDEIAESDSSSLQSEKLEALKKQADELIATSNEEESRALYLEEMAADLEQSAQFAEREAARLTAKNSDRKGTFSEKSDATALLSTPFPVETENSGVVKDANTRSTDISNSGPLDVLAATGNSDRQETVNRSEEAVESTKKAAGANDGRRLDEANVFEPVTTAAGNKEGNPAVNELPPGSSATDVNRSGVNSDAQETDRDAVAYRSQDTVGVTDRNPSSETLDAALSAPTPAEAKTGIAPNMREVEQAAETEATATSTAAGSITESVSEETTALDAALQPSSKESDEVAVVDRNVAAGAPSPVSRQEQQEETAAITSSQSGQSVAKDTGVNNGGEVMAENVPRMEVGISTDPAVAEVTSPQEQDAATSGRAEEEMAGSMETVTTTSRPAAEEITSQEQVASAATLNEEPGPISTSPAEAESFRQKTTTEVSPSASDDQSVPSVNSQTAFPRNSGNESMPDVMVTAADIEAVRTPDFSSDEEDEDTGLEAEESNRLTDTFPDPAAAATYLEAAEKSQSRADQLQRQSAYLQERASNMPEDDVRDSILSVSYDFSSEAMRQQQISQRQLERARAADPAVTPSSRLLAAELQRASVDAGSGSVAEADLPEVVDKDYSTTGADLNPGTSSRFKEDEPVATYSENRREGEGVNRPAASDRVDPSGEKVSAGSRTTQIGERVISEDIIASRQTESENQQASSPTNVERSGSDVRGTEAATIPASGGTKTAASDPASRSAPDRGEVETSTASANARSTDEIVPSSSSNPVIDRDDSRVPAFTNNEPLEDGRRVDPMRTSSEGGAMSQSTDSRSAGTRSAAADTLPTSSEKFATEEDRLLYEVLVKDAEQTREGTIYAFTQAVELNKQAVQYRQQYIDALEKADRTTDSTERERLLAGAEELKEKSVASEDKAREKYQEARELTVLVDSLDETAESLKLSEPVKTVATSASPAAQAEGSNPLPQQERLTISPASRKAPAAYTADRPIPRDPELPSGLVFKVQIGAFRKPIPEGTFGGLKPLTAENTRPGWIRYCIGLFRTFEPADLVKKEVRSIGYRDAFVVAYLDGKRISLAEAAAKVRTSGPEIRAGYMAASRQEVADLRPLNIVPAKYVEKNSSEAALFREAAQGREPGTSLTLTGTTEDTRESSSVTSSSVGIQFAVQVGVYRTENVPTVLSPLQPLQVDRVRNLYRFTTGLVASYTEAQAMKVRATAAGVPDAFIVAFRNGQRIAVADALRAVPETAPVRTEPVRTAPVIDANVTVQPEPRIKEGVVFRVQLGAFRNNVPFDVVDAFLKISSQGIERETDDRGLQIFYSGRFGVYADALAARDEAASKGVKDAFVAAFVDGRKVSVATALERLRR